MNQNTLPCSNCKAQIDESKHALHEMFCLRNNIKCPKCGHFYDKNDPESHEEEFHRKEKCQHCQKEFDDLSKHSCSMKPKQCLYCDLTFPQTQFQQHENYCGSRTEKCDKCAQSIMKREIRYHQCALPKQEIIKKPTQQEIFDKPKEFDANYEQQKYATKKETNITTQKPQGNGQKFTQAQSERPIQQTIKFNEKVSDNNQTRPTSNQQNKAQQNQASSYNAKKSEQTQFDSQYDKEQYKNKQKQPPPKQVPPTLESFNRPVVKPTTQPREQLKRPDTAIAREFQKQQEIEDLGLTQEEYLQQQMIWEQMEKQSKPQPQQYQQQTKSQTQQQQQSKPSAQSKAQQPSHQQKSSQPINLEDEFEFMTKEEQELQKQLLESLQKNKK